MVAMVLYSTGNVLMTAFTLGIMLLILPLGWFLIGRLSQVSYDDNFLYMKTFLDEVKVEIGKVRTVNQGNFLDPAFEIEFLTEKETIQKIDFMLPLAEYIEFVLLRKVPESILLFKRKIGSTI